MRVEREGFRGPEACEITSKYEAGGTDCSILRDPLLYFIDYCEILGVERERDIERARESSEIEISRTR